MTGARPYALCISVALAAALVLLASAQLCLRTSAGDSSLTPGLGPPGTTQQVGTWQIAAGPVPRTNNTVSFKGRSVGPVSSLAQSGQSIASVWESQAIEIAERINEQQMRQRREQWERTYRRLLQGKLETLTGVIPARSRTVRKVAAGRSCDWPVVVAEHSTQALSTKDLTGTREGNRTGST